MNLVDNEIIRKSDSGQIERPISTLVSAEQTWDQVTLLITNEYARMVDENPDYEFGIVGDNVQGILRITWKKRV